MQKLVYTQNARFTSPAEVSVSYRIFTKTSYSIGHPARDVLIDCVVWVTDAQPHPSPRLFDHLVY